MKYFSSYLQHSLNIYSKSAERRQLSRDTDLSSVSHSGFEKAGIDVTVVTDAGCCRLFTACLQIQTTDARVNPAIHMESHLQTSAVIYIFVVLKPSVSNHFNRVLNEVSRNSLNHPLPSVILWTTNGLFRLTDYYYMTFLPFFDVSRSPSFSGLPVRALISWSFSLSFDTWASLVAVSCICRKKFLKKHLFKRWRRWI